MIDQYYRQELDLLRRVAADFGRDNPTLAGLLREGSTDPDVERLLEGTAFLAGDIRRDLDGRFPDLVQELLQIVSPHFLRPIPATTTIAFQPAAGLREPLTVPAGTHLDSETNGAGQFRFRTCFDVRVQPLQLSTVAVGEAVGTPDGGRSLPVAFRFSTGGVPLSELALDRIRLHFAGEYAEAADRYFFLRHYLRGVAIEGGGSRHDGGPEAVRAVGFDAEEALLPQPGNLLPAFRVAHEYFLYPRKHLYLDVDLTGWMPEPGATELEVRFLCEQPAFPVPDLQPEHFALHATPAVNLFEAESDPVTVDHTATELPLRPREADPRPAVYSVDGLEGVSRAEGTRRRYKAFSAMEGDAESPTYQVHLRPEPRSGEARPALSVAYPQGGPTPGDEVLVARLTCTQGQGAERLAPGEIRIPTGEVPELVSFRNLDSPQPGTALHLDEEPLWHLLSDLSFNYLSFADAENLRTFLTHNVRMARRNADQEGLNQKRVNGLQTLTGHREERLFGGYFVRGTALQGEVRQDHFLSRGDQYLFGCLLDAFFGGVCEANSFVALSFRDPNTGERTHWPAHLGTEPLL
ncbi:type VI secretion system baseplate subunit TssF [Thiohalorhabdus methylotrophus]|uniref:Type VI secretion system baseplate subunit TssF n=1 Tax=Thiohalorhabdus methylotrophus TaxID=3242694 RepID=A0ABV4TVU0_9GAMM